MKMVVTLAPEGKKSWQCEFEGNEFQIEEMFGSVLNLVMMRAYAQMAGYVPGANLSYEDLADIKETEFNEERRVTCALCEKSIDTPDDGIQAVWQEMESDERVIASVHKICAWRSVKDTLYARDESKIGLAQERNPLWIGWEPRPFMAPWEEQ